jgi:hypothetical protein
MSPTNDTWMLFKQEVVDKCLRDWRCSSVSEYRTNLYYLSTDDAGQVVTNYYSGWVRTQFTDELGVVHHEGDANWANYAYQPEHPAAPEDDLGESTGNVQLASEQYAMVFAFMARLLQGDTNAVAERAEYLNAARECLFKVVDQAHLGVANLPWRQPNFAQNDRSFYAEAFALTVDWIYEDLTPVELAKIRKAFLTWAKQSNDHIYFAPHQQNGQHGPPNSTDLLRLDDPEAGPTRYEVRLALNNHYANHARQLVLYGLALDPKDDVPVTAGSPAYGIVDDAAPAGAVTSQLAAPGQPDTWVQQTSGVLYDTLGVWLYLMDYAYRHDGAGGISTEGTQYASNGLGPAALLMAALHSAGQDDPQRWGPQVTLAHHPFWSKVVPAYLAMLTPTNRVPGFSTGENYLGPVFQPPLTGDLETFLYLNNQFIKVLAPMALYDASVNGPTAPIAQAVRYIQRHLAPGGTAGYATRMSSMRSNKTLRDAIYTFLVMDPAAPAPQDPRPALQPRTFYASRVVNGREMGALLARSGPSPADTYFYTHLNWVGIDHIRGDGMTFGLWKNGLWLTKPMTGYGTLQGCSDYRNSLSLQNGIPTSTPVGEDVCAEHGSQWNYSSLGDPQIRARSFSQDVLYVDLDGTALYQHRQQTQLREVTHASRRMVWLKPDVLVIHDVARSKQAGYFKRFYLNTPGVTQVSGNVAHATAAEDGAAKAELFVTQLLPAGAIMQTNDIKSGQPAGGEDMRFRLFTQAPNHPQEAHFLHVVEGANAGTPSPLPAQTVYSASGAAFEGAVVGTTAVLFRQDPDSLADTFSYAVPATVTKHCITGLAKSAGYGVSMNTANGQTTVTVTAGGAQGFSDTGGMLVIGGNNSSTVSVAATDAQGAESGNDPVAFEFHRTGDVTNPLTVNVQCDGGADASDFATLPATVQFAAGSPVATLTLVPIDDATYEGAETITLRVVAGPGYAPDEVQFEAEAEILDNDAPPGGYIQFASGTFSANEADGLASITIHRSGGTAGNVSAQVSAPGLQPPMQPVSWPDGDANHVILTFQFANDAVYTGDRQVTLTLGGAAGGAATGSPATAVLTIVDDEPAPPGQITFASASTNVTEGAGALTLWLQRVNGNGGAASVNISASGTATQGADFTLSTTNVAWAAGDSDPKPLIVNIIQDNTFEGASEAFTLTLSIASGSATLGAQPAFTTTIADDDPQPQIYHVGSGQDYPTIGSVPWKNLGPGAQVYIHWQPAAYHEKILISGRGSAGEPIKVAGVPGPNGEKPVIDGANATASASLGYESWSYTPQMGVVSIARGANTPANGKAGYIELSGLEVRNTIGQSYSQADGSTDSYWSSSGAIYLRGAEHVVVRDCDLHHAYHGLVAENYSTEAEINRDLLIESCWFHDNTQASSWSQHNLKTEGVGVTVQFCRFDPNLNRDKTANVTDQSAGAVFRCNWIEGGSPAIEFIEPMGAPAVLSSEPSFGAAHACGNVIIGRSGDGSSLIRFGGSYYGNTAFFRPLLHFYHNTLFLDSTSTGRSVFSLAQTAPLVQARNNAFHSAASQFQMISSSSGTVTMGVNWARTGWFAGWSGGVVNGAANVITGVDPGFAGLAAGDFHLTALSPLRNVAGPLIPGVPAVNQQYKASASAESRATTVDIGAFGFFTPPSVTTLAATDVTATGATLQGTIIPQTGPVTTFFEWGVTTAYGAASQPLPLAGGSNPLQLTTQVTGLPAHSLVHYRLTAQASGTTYAGADLSFTTANTPPAAAPDTFATKVNTLLVLNTSKLLENDADNDGDALTVVAVSPASAQGGQALLSNGFLTYAPPPNFTGDDAISYKVSDGIDESAPAIITIHVEPVSAPLLLLQGVGLSGAGNLVVSFVTQPLATWTLQASADLVQWQALGPASANAQGLVQWEDPAGNGATARFYRLVTP